MKKSLLVGAILALFTSHAAMAHTHSNSGDNNHDGYLDFDALLPTLTLLDSGTSFQADSGFIFSGAGDWTATAQHKSDYSGSGVTDTNGPLSGTYIRLVLVSVDGPAGGNFAFFEEGDTAPTFTLAVGTTGGTDDYSFSLTEDDYFALSPSDPYGHIHGRTFGFDVPGTYTLTWALENTGTAGTLSSTLNPDASLRTFTQTMVAVPEPSTWALLLLGAGCIVFLTAKTRQRSA